VFTEQLFGNYSGFQALCYNLVKNEDTIPLLSWRECEDEDNPAHRYTIMPLWGFQSTCMHTVSRISEDCQAL
jgi:hypothetical protein